MRVILLSDIFGDTPALRNLANALIKQPEIVTPYLQANLHFSDQAEAYQYFCHHSSIADYSEIVRHSLLTTKQPSFVIGFSVGASAIWHLAGNCPPKNITGAVAFYGGQIRHYSELHPDFPVELVFPESESHFSVADLMSKLAGRRNIVMRQAAALHGFMNAQTAHFCEQGYHKNLQALNHSIKKAGWQLQS